MKKLCKPVSILLSLIMIVSLFTTLPTAASAEELDVFYIPASDRITADLREKPTRYSMSVSEESHDGVYSNYSSGILDIRVPDGKGIRITGTVKTVDASDGFAVYTPSGDTIAAYKGSQSVNVYTDAKRVWLQFFCRTNTGEEGVSLTVTVMDLCNVTFASGGASGSMPDQKAAGGIVLPACTFTAPAGRMFVGWKSIIDNRVYSPGDAVEFSYDTTFVAQWQDGYIVPSSGNHDLDLSGKATGYSVDVYDSGGPSGYYLDKTDGTLTIIPPDGKGLNIAGTINTEFDFAYLYVLGGSRPYQLISKTGYTSIDLPTAARPVILRFKNDLRNNFNYDGFALTVTVIDANTITYSAGDGTGTMTGTVALDSLTLPECGFTPPAGKLFSGWKSSADNSVHSPGETITIGSNTTFTAQYQAYVTASFAAGEGSGSAPADIERLPGTEIALPENSFTAPENYTFVGWSDGTEIYNPGARYTLTNDVTFTAQWELLMTVNFVTNEGSGSAPATVKQIAGTQINLPSNTFTSPENKRFVGWSDGANVYNAGSSYTVTGDVTFTAQWEEFYYMPANGGKTVDLSGKSNGYHIIVYDDGGPDEDYSYNADGTLTIIPPADKGLRITIKNNTEPADDKLYVYGVSESNQYFDLSGNEDGYLAGVYDNYKILTVESPVVLKFISDNKNNLPGFEINVTVIDTAYTITWKNEDGTVIETDYNVSFGTTPSFDGERPTKPGDNEGIYVFTEWSPEVSAVTDDAVYTACFAQYVYVAMTEPYIDDEGAYIVGQKAHYEAGGRYYAVNDDGSIGEEVTEASIINSYFIFEKNSDGTCKITRYLGSATEIVIPDTYEDVAVTELGSNKAYDYVLSNNSSEITLVLGKNIRAINQFAFYEAIVREITGDTSSLRSFGTFSLKGAFNNRHLYIKLDYPGNVYFGSRSLYARYTHISMKHATTVSLDNTEQNSINFNFTDEHTYGDPVWTWADDCSSATATFTCTDVRCNHQETVNATITPEVMEARAAYIAVAEMGGTEYTDTRNTELPVTPAVEPYIDENGAYILGTIDHYEFGGRNYAVNENGSIGEELSDLSLSYFDFALINNDSEYQIKYYIGPKDNLSKLVIPKTYNGKQVTVLGVDNDDTFMNYGDNAKTQFNLVMNENIREIKNRSFYTMWVTEVKGDTSGLSRIGDYAFSWANSPGGYTLDITLDYPGRITVGREIFNNMKVTARIKHATTFSSTSFSARSVDNVFTDAHHYGDPVWTWTDDYSSATAKFTCADSRCKHEETVSAAITSETKDGIITYTATAELDGSTYTDVKTAFADGVGAGVVGHSISLDGDIAVNFYMELSDSIIAHKDTAYMHFTIPTGSGTTEQDMLVKDARVVESGDKTYYVFKCRVAAKEMTSEIKAQMIDGENEGVIYTYSVKEYADYLLTHAHEREDLAAAAPLVKKMLNYGAYAQIYFDKNPGTLANSDLAAADKVFSDPEIDIAAPDESKLPEGVTFEGATLSLKSETTLSLYFKSSDPLEFSCDGYTVEKATSGGYQIARIRGIKAKHIGDILTLKIGGEDAISYSPLNYCKNVLDDDTTDEKLINVVKALYLYWQAADVYFKS